MKTSSKKCYLKHAHAFVHQLVDKTNDNKLASVFFAYLFYLCTYLYTHVSESSGFDAVFLPIENERQWPPIAIFHLVGNLSVPFIYNGVSFFCKHFDLINCYGTEEKLLAVILSRLFYWLGNFSTFNYKIRLFRTLFLVLPTLFRLATVFIDVHTEKTNNHPLYAPTSIGLMYQFVTRLDLFIYLRDDYCFQLIVQSYNSKSTWTCWGSRHLWETPISMISSKKLQIKRK